MSSYNLLKGHDIRLKGNPKKDIVDIPLSSHIAIHPAQYKGMKPKLLVKKGDSVKVGSPIFYDKTKESVKVVDCPTLKVEVNVVESPTLSVVFKSVAAPTLKES